MKMDWRKAGNTTVDAGVYEVVVKAWKPDTSRNNNPVIRLTYEIVGPEGNPNLNRVLPDSITLTDAAAWRLAWFVGSTGIVLESLGEMDSESEEFRRVLDTCVGRKLWVTTVIDSYEGVPRNKITDYAKSDDQEETEITEEVPDFIKRRG
jgi:hypothetical protein